MKTRIEARPEKIPDTKLSCSTTSRLRKTPKESKKALKYRRYAKIVQIMAELTPMTVQSCSTEGVLCNYDSCGRGMSLIILTRIIPKLHFLWVPRRAINKI